MVILTYLAREAIDRPVDPDGLVLVATAAGRLTEGGLGRLLATPFTAALVALVDHTPQRVFRALVGPGCAAVGRWCGCGRAERATLAMLAAAALAQTPVSTVVGFLPSLRDYDQAAVLGSIRARTVVVSGGRDLLTPAVHAHDLAAAIPGASHVHVPSGGHMLPQQVPHVIDEAIRQVMALPPSTAPAAGPRVGWSATATGEYASAGGAI
jgi:pimeloyl-ACP methyl ester carboxylesterase